MTYQSTATLSQLATRIKAAQSVVCTAHAKPDGDAAGSVMGITRALADTHQVQSWFAGPVPPAMQAIIGDTPWVSIRDASDIPADEPDLILILDTGARSQLHPMVEWLDARRDQVIGIDHHASGDDVAPDRYIDATAASCTMLVLELIDCLGIDLTPSMATPLFAGLATDTGWFRQANADAQAFATAARLLACDVDKAGLFRAIEETARPQRLALHACALQSIEWRREGQVAVMRLTQDDFEATQGRRSEVTGLVNAPLVVAGAEMAALLLEESSGAVKVSMRSKPAAHAGGDFFDVSRIARELGGGGHVHAAGAEVHGSLEAVSDQLDAAIDRCRA